MDVAEEVIGVGCITGDRIKGLVDGVSGLAVQGIDAFGEVHAMGLRVSPCLEDEFIRTHPKKTIDELVCLDEEGVFVVGGKVEGLVEGAEWWYSAYRCNRSVLAASGSYYCNGCVRHCKVKVKVSDGECKVILVLFDNDVSFIVKKSCAKLVADVKVSFKIKCVCQVK
ncbi:putative zeaxanthin epoxidase [Medicago truncatula]|uniref:Putative zeaxanthin epoxidase n=1 Tax=Medicago truncatula TaxID=3880 RepID=A0A396ILG1_MEDTR|nr:putative zeaxanthin epoxidase [Medicago truncatula]